MGSVTLMHNSHLLQRNTLPHTWSNQPAPVAAVAAGCQHCCLHTVSCAPPPYPCYSCYVCAEHPAPVDDAGRKRFVFSHFLMAHYPGLLVRPVVKQPHFDLQPLPLPTLKQSLVFPSAHLNHQRLRHRSHACTQRQGAPYEERNVVDFQIFLGRIWTSPYICEGCYSARVAVIDISNDRPRMPNSAIFG